MSRQNKIVHYDPETLDLDVLETFNAFWATVPDMFTDGILNLNALMNELHDYKMMMGEVAQVYCEVTDGRVSKQNTAASVVLEFYRESLQKSYEDGYNARGEVDDDYET